MRRTAPTISLGLILAVFFSVFTVFSSAEPAQAAPYWDKIQNFKAQERCAFSWTRYENVLLHKCQYSGMDQGQWHSNRVGTSPGGYPKIQLRNKHTGLCLSPGTKSKGAFVYTNLCYFRDGRVNGMTVWVAKGEGLWGVVKLRKAGTSNCLGVDGTEIGAHLRLWGCRPDAPYQKWFSRTWLQ